MRRKSERTSTKKTKASPEKKVDKSKRTRNRRRKHSNSSENESGDEASPVQNVGEVSEEKLPPSTPVKEDSPEEAQEVWHVKAPQASGDVGEIHKLKICLTRPPSTPERADKSPRSKRKHSRATSSSDTPSVEGESDSKRKSKHRSKKSRESRDEYDKNQDSQEDEQEADSEHQVECEISQSTESKPVSDETPMSTTNEENKPVENTEPKEESSTEKPAQDDECTADSAQQGDESNVDSEQQDNNADTTVVSPKADSQTEVNTTERESPKRQRSTSVEKSEVLEIHADESKCESSDVSKEQNESSNEREVSISEDKVEKSSNKEVESDGQDKDKTTNKTDVVECTESDKKRRTRFTSVGSNKEKEVNEDSIHNGQAPPIVVSRKRKWGSRPKITKQKSITISTDVLREIIPDVKPVEFEEVIEEKKHRRVEVTEKFERPILPKIVIDNTHNVEQNKKEQEENIETDKARESHMSANRRISIVNDDDSIIARPPSPPLHKPSNILFITNLVRPFTLPQLKNLLQRTGRIVENGFWIDRIKSKCFVKYENEDQAVETRHALHGVTWPVSNPKALQVDFSTQEAFDKALQNEDTDNAQASTIPGTVEDWLREQDMKRERGEVDKPWERKQAVTREWDVGKNEKDREKDGRLRRDERPMEKRRHHSPSPEPARKFKKKEEEAPAKLLDDLFRKTKTTPCIYWLPLSAETIAVKEEQRRQHMAEHERRLQELRRTQHRRH